MFIFIQVAHMIFVIQRQTSGSTEGEKEEEK